MRASSFSTDTIKHFCIYKKIATALYVMQSERADLEATENVTTYCRRGKKVSRFQVGIDIHRVIDLATDPFLDGIHKVQRLRTKSCRKSKNKRNVIVLCTQTALPSSTEYQREQR